MSRPVRKPWFQEFDVPAHGTRTPNWFVLHDTESSDKATIQGLAAMFRGTSEGLGIDLMVQADGTAGMVKGGLTVETYHVANHNSTCIGLEQIGFASLSRVQWLKRRRQIYMSAWIVAWACQQLNIPLIPAGSEKTGRRFIHSKGVTQHRWVPNNDHDDCGTGYPFAKVLELAQRWQRTGGPSRTTRLFIRHG